MPNRRNRRSRPPTGPVNRGFREGRFEVRGDNVWEMSDDSGVDPQGNSTYPGTNDHNLGYSDAGYQDAGYSESGYQEYPDSGIADSGYPTEHFSQDNFGQAPYDDGDGYHDTTYVADNYSGTDYSDNEYPDTDQTQVLPVYDPQASYEPPAYQDSGFNNTDDTNYFEPEFTEEYAQDYSDPNYEYHEDYPGGYQEGDYPEGDYPEVAEDDVAEQQQSGRSRHAAPTTRGGAHTATRSRRSNRRRAGAKGGLAKSKQTLAESGFAQKYRAIIQQFGWRAYVIPILTVITIWVLIDIAIPEKDNSTDVNNTGKAANSSANVADPGLGPDPATAQAPTLPITELPAGGTFTMTGTGAYRTVGVPGAQRGEGTERTFTYIVEIEEGINTSAYGGDDAFATLIDATLTNVKGWTNDPRYRFEHIQETEDLKPDLRIQLTSVETTHSLCGTDIEMETSCFYGEGGRVVINESRWVRGATPFQGDLGAYRQYLINHEVGHGIGYADHDPCGGQGKLAPIMMQQTLSLSNSELAMIDPNEVYKDDGLVCVSNPWPYPHA